MYMFMAASYLHNHVSKFVLFLLLSCQTRLPPSLLAWCFRVHWTMTICTVEPPHKLPRIHCKLPTVLIPGSDYQHYERLAMNLQAKVFLDCGKLYAPWRDVRQTLMIISRIRHINFSLSNLKGMWFKLRLNTVFMMEKLVQCIKNAV